jgi:oligosaccharide reducing-end xylanase
MKKLLSYFIIVSLTAYSCSTGQKSLKKNSENKAALKEANAGAYYTGIYRNLFLENGHPAGEILAKNESAYQLLFHGDSATQAVVFNAGRNENGPMAYVCDVLHNDVRSEGISYGMMIAVQMNK